MIEVKKLKKGDYIIHKSEPWMVKDIVSVVTSTHTHTKIKLSITGLFNGMNETFTLPPHERVENIEIIRKHAQVISKTDTKVQILDLKTYETLDANAYELFDKLKVGDEVTYVEFNNIARIIEIR
jgi:translation elongation factor P/translation initiation factor 5A